MFTIFFLFFFLLALEFVFPDNQLEFSCFLALGYGVQDGIRHGVFGWLVVLDHLEEVGWETLHSDLVGDELFELFVAHYNGSILGHNRTWYDLVKYLHKLFFGPRVCQTDDKKLLPDLFV